MVPLAGFTVDPVVKQPRIVVSAHGASGSDGTPARIAPISRHGDVGVHGAQCPLPGAA
jgi:hypothetical protein